MTRIVQDAGPTSTQEFHRRARQLVLFLLAATVVFLAPFAFFSASIARNNALERCSLSAPTRYAAAHVEVRLQWTPPRFVCEYPRRHDAQ